LWAPFGEEEKLKRKKKKKRKNIHGHAYTGYPLTSLPFGSCGGGGYHSHPSSSS
jgi:hypothetical protein